MRYNIKWGLIAILLAVSLEIFLFNFRFIESKFFKPFEAEYIIEHNSSIERTETGGYLILSKVEESPIITIKNINNVTNNLFLDFNIIYPETDIMKKPITIQLQVIDQGHSAEYYWNPKHFLIQENFLSKFIQLNASGNTSELKIIFPYMPESEITINAIDFNVQRPLAFSSLRCLFTLLIIMCFIIYKPHSKLYHYFFDSTSKVQKYLIALICLVQCGVLIYNINLNPRFHVNESVFDNEYGMLAQSFAKGKLNIDVPVSDSLKNLSNPYDASLREKEKADFLWDFAYYDEQYYVYFGIVPAILYYLPYYLITNNTLLNFQANTISLILFTIGIFMLLYEVIKKYFSKIPFIIYILLSITLINVSGAFYISHHSDIYSVPIILGLALTALGLSFWLKSKKEDHLNRYYLFLGSLFMALVAGCRPQLLLFSFFAIFIFFDYIKQIFANKKVWVELLVALLPYIIIGVSLMLYNYIRFDSAVDFGATYNLTSNDMTLRGFKLDRIGTGLFYYLFKLPDTSPLFPFVHLSPIETNYMGLTISDSTGYLMGALPTSLLIAISFAIFYTKRLFIHKSLWLMGISSLIFGIFVCILDAQMAGILHRYLYDILLFLLLPAVLVIFAFNQHYASSFRLKNTFNFIVFIFCLLSLSLVFLTYFMPEGSGLVNTNTDFYFKFYRLIQFWL